MNTEDRKLDISAISFDDMLGDGLTSVPDEPTQEPEQEELEELEPELEEEEPEYEEEGYEEEDESEFSEADAAGEGIIFEIASTLGFEVSDEYEDSVEGLTNFVRDISQEAAEEQLNQLFEQYPEVQRHLDFLMSGGNSADFVQAYNPQVDFGAIEIEEEDINTQRAILANYFQAKGHDNEFIGEMLETLEANGKLFSKSEFARNELAQYQEQHRQEMFAQQQAEFQRRMQETEQFWEDVANTIETGNEFAGIRIPDRQKAAFFEYISEPVGPNGETQRDLDYQQSELEMKLAMDYLVFSGFKLDDIINTKARTKSVESLRDRIANQEARVKSARKASRSKQFDVDSLDMNALLG